MIRSECGGYRVKNLARYSPPRDFHYGALSFFALAALVAAGVVVQRITTPTPFEVLAGASALALVLAGVAFLLPVWSAVVPLAVLSAAGLLLFPDLDLTPLAAGVGLGVLLSPLSRWWSTGTRRSCCAWESSAGCGALASTFCYRWWSGWRGWWIPAFAPPTSAPRRPLPAIRYRHTSTR